MKKEVRQKVFDMYGGKCAYCGFDLQAGWHVDHVEPIVRKRKYVKGYWLEVATKKKMTPAEINELPESTDFVNNYKWIEDHWKVDGSHNPQNETIDNYMPACASCNIQKHSQPVEAFRKQIENFVDSLNKYHSIYRFAKRYGLVEETGSRVEFYFETLEQPASKSGADNGREAKEEIKMLNSKVAQLEDALRRAHAWLNFDAWKQQHFEFNDYERKYYRLNDKGSVMPFTAELDEMQVRAEYVKLENL